MNNKKDYKVWFPVNMMEDPRTEKLLAETGYKGLGVLFAAIIAVEHFYMTTPSLNVIINFLNVEVSRGFCKKINCDYGFFEIDANGNIAALLNSDSRASVRA